MINRNKSKLNSNRIEFAGAFLVLALLPSCVTNVTPTEPLDIKRREIANQIPILMVHGLHGRSEHFDVMRGRFARAGWDEDLLYAIDLSNPKRGRVGINIAHAEEIRDKVDVILTSTGHEELIIIAHSMGVLSSMYYIKEFGGTEKVDTFIGLDGRIQPNPVPLRWLMPDTKKSTQVMTVLNEPDITPGGVLPDTLYPNAHEPGDMRYNVFFQFKERAMFDGADVSHFPDVGHVAFLTDADVFLEILDLLIVERN